MDDNEKLWAIFVPGPDDIWAMPSKMAAEDAVNRNNSAIDSEEWPFPELRLTCKASVIEWPYDGESHAESLNDEEPG